MIKRFQLKEVPAQAYDTVGKSEVESEQVSGLYILKVISFDPGRVTGGHNISNRIQRRALRTLQHSTYGHDLLRFKPKKLVLSYLIVGESFAQTLVIFNFRYLFSFLLIDVGEQYRTINMLSRVSYQIRLINLLILSFVIFVSSLFSL